MCKTSMSTLSFRLNMTSYVLVVSWNACLIKWSEDKMKTWISFLYILRADSGFYSTVGVWSTCFQKTREKVVNTVVPLMIIMKCNRKSLKTLQYYTAVEFYHTITLFHFQFCGLCYRPDISWKNVPWSFKIFIIYIDIKYNGNQILTAENFGGWITQLYCIFALNDFVIIFLFIIRKIREWIRMLFFNNFINH